MTTQNDMKKEISEMQDSFLKCETEKDLRETIKPYVTKILDRYRDSCYGTITATADSLKSELYDLKCFVYRNSRFSMRVIEETMELIIRCPLNVDRKEICNGNKKP